MLMNICLMRSRPSLFLSRQLASQTTRSRLPIPHDVARLDLNGIPLTRTRAQTAIRTCTTSALDGLGISRKKNIIFGADVIDVRPFSARSFASASTYPCSPLTPTPLVSSSTLIRGPWSGPSPPYLTSPSPLSLATTTNTNNHVSTPGYDDRLHRAKSTYRGSA